ncbi:MAG TPA: hypothetical protein DIT95_17070 [Arenibacter sp.]|nr:hypothetical protein [Arenibacter sp.]
MSCSFSILESDIIFYEYKRFPCKRPRIKVYRPFVKDSQLYDNPKILAMLGVSWYQEIIND